MRNIRFKKNEFLTDTNLIAKKDLTIKELEAKVFKMGKPPSSTATSKESQQGDSANSKLSKSSVGTTNAAEPTLSEKTT